MKNYHEMTDHKINKEVEKLTGMYCEDVCGNYVSTKDYCNNPSDAWPIIFDNKIAVAPYILGESSIDYKEFKGKWFAMSLVDESWNDLNPLRAAMIVFLMMKDKENS